jgi:hypothetical protein
MKFMCTSIFSLHSALTVVFLGSSIGCATRGDLANVQQDLRNGLATVRAQEQGLADLKRHMQSLSAAQEKLTASQAQMNETLRQVVVSEQLMSDAKQHLEGSYREKARLEGILHAMEATLRKTLKSEQAELKDRLQVLDKAVKDLGMGGPSGSSITGGMEPSQQSQQMKNEQLMLELKEGSEGGGHRGPDPNQFQQKETGPPAGQH